MDAEAARMAEAFLRDFADDDDQDLELQEDEEEEGQADGWDLDEADDATVEWDNPFAAAAAELDEEEQMEAVLAVPKVRVQCLATALSSCHTVVYDYQCLHEDSRL
jgi:hypothetical protein